MANGKKKRGFIRYKSYNFVDKDPIIDLVRTARSDARKSVLQVHEASGVSATTLYNWEIGKTRRPMFATAFAVVIALGKKGIGIRAGKPYLID